MKKVCSEDAVRRAIGTLDEGASTEWLQTISYAVTNRC